MRLTPLLTFAAGMGVGAFVMSLNADPLADKKSDNDVPSFDYVLQYDHTPGPDFYEMDKRDWEARQLDLSESEMSGPNDYPAYIAQQCELKRWSISTIDSRITLDTGDSAFLSVPNETIDRKSFLCLARFAESPFVNFAKEDPINAQTH